MTTHDTGNVRRLAEATEWLTRLRGTPESEDTVTSWLRWCEQDPENPQAFELIQGLWRTLGHVYTDPRELEALLGQAASREREVQETGRLLRLLRPFGERWRFSMGAAAAIILAAALLTLWYGRRPLQEVPYVAQSIAANHTSMLPDGSTIDLGGRTSVAVDFSGPQRRLRLSPGEAFFKVRPDKTRPFVVRAGSLDEMAVGTAFDVKQAPDRVIVTVQEGLVGITPADTSAKHAPESAWQVRAGDQFIYSEADATATLASVDTSSALAWRAGRLEYVNAPLSLVIADVNRYASRPLGSAIRSLRSSPSRARCLPMPSTAGSTHCPPRCPSFSSRGPGGNCVAGRTD